MRSFLDHNCIWIDLPPDLSRIEDAQAIHRLVNGLRFSPDVGFLLGLRCMCGGDFILRFHEADDRVTEMTLHHGKNLRCPDLWWGDARLGGDSSSHLAVWITEQGVFEQLTRLRTEDLAQSGRRRLTQ